MATDSTREPPQNLDDVSQSLLDELDEEEMEDSPETEVTTDPPELDDAADPSEEEDIPAESDETDPETESAGEQQPRGADGKFIPKDATEVAPPAPAAAVAAPPEKSPPAPPPPFSVRAGGRDYPLDGVVRGADGSLTVSSDHAARVTRLLQQGVHHETAWRAEHAEMQRKLATHDTESEKGKLITRHLLGLLDKGPDAVAEWLDEYEQNKGRLLLEIEKEQLATERQALTQGREAEATERMQAEIAQWVEQSIPGEIQEAAQQFAGVFEPADLTRIGQRIASVSDRIFLVADRDFSASEMAAMGYPDSGPAQRGERFVDSSAIHAILAEEAAVIQRERTRAAEQVRQAKAALATNARNAGGSRRPPAAVPAGGSSDAPTKDGSRAPSNMSEWKDSLMAEI